MKHTASGKAFTDLVLQIFRTNSLLLAAVDKLAATEGITSAHWQVLGAIADEPRSVAQIGRIMGLTRQSVQRVANIMVDKGICSFESNPLHRKAKLLSLTKRGIGTISKMDQIQIQWANSLAKSLVRRDLDTAVTVLSDICAILTREKK